MGSGVEKEYDSEPLKKKENNLIDLRELRRKLKMVQRDAFRRKHGNPLSLLEVEVDISAITTLAQYYDPPLRCFTFQDFQLVSTIEEFEQILDLSMEGRFRTNILKNTVLSRLKS